MITRTRHSTVILGASIMLVMGCATAAPAKPFDPTTAPADPCDPEYTSLRPLVEQRALAEARRTEPIMGEMTVYLAAPAERVTPRLMAALMRCNVPVSQSTGGIIESDYGEHTGMLGLYAIKTRAVVVSVGDSATIVRFSGQETSKTGRALNPTVTTHQITNRNSGVSGNAWISMRNVAKQLLADRSLNPVAEKSVKLSTLYMPAPR